MRILFISYGDFNFDGRMRSLLDVFSQIGEVHAYTRGSVPFNANSKVSKSNYMKFIWEAVNFAKGCPKFEWLVLDNRKSTIPGLLIRLFFRPELIIQDCRELYLLRDTNYLVGKIGCIFEQFSARRANVVICANQERAGIMQREFSLDKEPLVYENLRALKYETAESRHLVQKKLAKYFKEDEIRIVGTCGCSIARTNDVLAKSLKYVDKKVHLFLVGDSRPEEKKVILQIADQDPVNKITIVEKLNQSELKYFISQCHIGIVNYGQYDTNNKYCASGKLYEFIYEGLPVVTTTNPPLKRLCDEKGIGLADDQYAEAINVILHNYDAFKNRVLEFSSVNTIEKNDEKLIRDIKNLLRQ